MKDPTDKATVDMFEKQGADEADFAFTEIRLKEFIDEDRLWDFINFLPSAIKEELFDTLLDQMDDYTP